MAPTPIPEDYYQILKVDQTAEPALIIRSYKRLALELHPDRNARDDATEAFQLVCMSIFQGGGWIKPFVNREASNLYGGVLNLNQTLKLGQAYAILKDESKRRDYDLIYPSIIRSRPSPQSPRSPPTSSAQPEALSEAAQIAALQKSKQERSARWRIERNASDSSIFEIQRDVRQLEQEIRNLNVIVAAEVAEEVQKKSWRKWLLSPLYKKKAEESEEEKARKDRERQERRMEMDMKERRLGLKKGDLSREESLLRKAKEEVDAEDLIENRKIRMFQDRIWTREIWERQERERQEKERERQERERERQERERERQEREKEEGEALEEERVERERIAKNRKQQQEQWEKWEREVAESLRKQQAKERAAEREIKAKSRKKQQEQWEEWEREVEKTLEKRREEEQAAERERMAKSQKQQQEQREKREREAEVLRTQQAEEQAAERERIVKSWKLQQEQEREVAKKVLRKRQAEE